MPFNGKIMMELKGRMTTGKEPESCLLITQPLVAAKKYFIFPLINHFGYTGQGFLTR